MSINTEFMGRTVWSPSPDIAWCVSEDAAIIFCPDTNRYHSLEHTGRLFWERLTQGATARDLSEHIAAIYPKASRSAIERDAELVIKQLAERQLIVQADTATKMPSIVTAQPKVEGMIIRSIKHSSPSSIVIRLMVIRLGLLTVGLRRVLAIVASATPGAVEGASTSDLVEVARRIAFAAPLSPLRAECLERSLCLMWLLRRSRAGVNLRFGVQLHPFAAHAWVDHHGTPVNDYVEHVRTFIPLTQVAA